MNDCRNCARGRWCLMDSTRFWCVSEDKAVRVKIQRDCPKWEGKEGASVR